MSTMQENPGKPSWWSLLGRYHWYVIALASLGWLFDTMDQQLFTASRSITMRDLLAGQPDPVRTQIGSYCTSIFIVGWATGGLIFGAIGDRWGRAKTMAVTILVYALFTGLSAVSRNWYEFALFRFLTGLGVGGEFAAGAALIAEVVPEAARARALGFMQSLSAVGNIIGATLFGLIEPAWGWRGLYVIGAFPALLAVVVRLGMKEPEKWVAAKAASVGPGAARLGSLRDLLGTPRWRRNALVGLALAVAGVIGLWGVGFYSPELIDKTLPAMDASTKVRISAVVAAETPRAHARALKALDENARRRYDDLLRMCRLPGEEVAAGTKLDAGRRARLQALLEKSLEPAAMTGLKFKALVLQQVGAFFGMFFFGVAAVRFGRRPSFLVSFILGWGSIALTFLTFESAWQVWYLWPILGFGALAPFGGYALYFPELFPTRLRTTGTGFCYNIGRYIAASGPPLLAATASFFDGKFTVPGFKLAAVVVASSYLIGIVALVWAPETKDQPLPE